MLCIHHSEICSASHYDYFIKIHNCTKQYHYYLAYIFKILHSIDLIINFSSTRKPPLETLFGKP